MPLFLLDGTKQLLSNGLVHFINVVFAIFVGSYKSGDPCGLYFTSVVIDVSLGTSISFMLLYAFDRFVSYQNSKVYDIWYQRLKSGNYFMKVESEGRVKYAIDYWCWFLQTSIWCLIVFFVVFVSHRWKWSLLDCNCYSVLSSSGWAIWLWKCRCAVKYRFEDYQQVKIVMVMFVVPIILNVLQVCEWVYLVPCSGSVH